jgi:uroporphyrinogen-III synthase
MLEAGGRPVWVPTIEIRQLSSEQARQVKAWAAADEDPRGTPLHLDSSSNSPPAFGSFPYRALIHAAAWLGTFRHGGRILGRPTCRSYPTRCCTQGLAAALLDLPRFDILAFTSANGIAAVLSSLDSALGSRAAAVRHLATSGATIYALGELR